MDSLISLSQEIHHLHADLCSAIADPTRILILYLLDDQSMTVNDLAARLEIAQPSASRHLKILRERGLVIANRQGQSVQYELNDRRIIEALNTLRGVLRDTLAYRAQLIAE